jgi:hypothetical protein
MQGIDIFDMRPLDASRLGKLQRCWTGYKTFYRVCGSEKMALADKRQAPQRTPLLSTLLVTSNTSVALASPPILTTCSGSLLLAKSPSLAAWSADPPTRCITSALQTTRTRTTTITTRTRTLSQRTWQISSSPSTSRNKCELLDWRGIPRESAHVA